MKDLGFRKCTEYQYIWNQNKYKSWYVKIIETCLLSYEQLKFVLKRARWKENK